MKLIYSDQCQINFPESHDVNIGSMKNRVGKDHDSHWYTDDEINQLLTHYLHGNNTVELLTAMLGTDIERGNDLHENLVGFNVRRLDSIHQDQIVKDTVMIPVNLHQGHWVLIYIIYQTGAAVLPYIYYFDPLGEELNENLREALNRSDLFPNAAITSIGKGVQQDSYNCGPWVVEAARAIAEQGVISELKHNIHQARSEHMAIIHPHDSSWSINIQTPNEYLSFDEKEKPVFNTDTGETVVEYTGLASDGNPFRSWAKATYQPGGYSRLHYHTERTEYYYIAQGVAQVKLDSIIYELSAGDTLVIPKGEEHQVHNVSPNDQELILIVKCEPSWVVQDSHLVEENTFSLRAF